MEYRHFVEEGLYGKIASPLKNVVDKVLLGSSDWVETMRRVLGTVEADHNLSELNHLVWRPASLTRAD